MRLIDADALLLRIDCHGTNKFGMLDEDIREYISKQPTISLESLQPQWIPVTERMPQEHQIVVGWTKDNPFSCYREEVVTWNGKGWVFVYAQRYVTNVKYWMPLPKPYKPEGLEDTE